MPAGLLGAFVAVMLAALVSTDEAYLHSWGSIFIQDVLVPWRCKRLEAQEHIRWLRLSILGLAVFSFLFSLLFKQSKYILLFFCHPWGNLRRRLGRCDHRWPALEARHHRRGMERSDHLRHYARGWHRSAAGDRRPSH